MFSVNVLFYGDHYHLAARCLGSIINNADWALIDEVRIGLNEVCPDTEAYVKEVCSRIIPPIVATYVYTPTNFTEPINAFKYPLMRRMFHDPDRPIPSKYVMWFDDDSFITSTSMGWWTQVRSQMDSDDMTGHIYVIRQRGDQFKHIEAQPWYGDKPVSSRHRYRFATGGWWTIRREVLDKWGYPFAGLRHRGGDSIMGELLRQQDYQLGGWHEGVAINAADATSGDSTAPRRGDERALREDKNWYLQHQDDEQVVNPLIGPEEGGDPPGPGIHFSVDVWEGLNPEMSTSVPEIIRLPGYRSKMRGPSEI